jgi:hypothetical protein
MASKVGMANAALSRLGITRITALTDSSEAARLCNSRFDDLLEELLQTSNWRFAVQRATLAPLSTAPTHGYTYQFDLPADCLHVVEEINDEEWQVENGRMVCDDNAPQIVYVARVTDMNRLSALFRAAFSLRLAAELAVPLAGSSALAERLFAQAERTLAQAAARDGQQRNIDEQEEGDWVTER